MKEETQRWVQAGCILADNPHCKVLCPICQKAILTVRDVRYEKKPEMFERYLSCPKCGAWNVLRMKKPVDEDENRPS